MQTSPKRRAISKRNFTLSAVIGTLLVLTGGTVWRSINRVRRSRETLPPLKTRTPQSGVRVPSAISTVQQQAFTTASLMHYIHGSNTKVLVGRNGWLFYRLGLDHVGGSGFLSPQFMAARARSGNAYDPRIAMRDWHAQLQRRGITLVLLPIPDKATLYPEQISPAYHGPPPHNPSFERWKREMAHDGIRVFDPTATLMRAKASTADWLYLPDDSHWTPYASQVCAQGLAQWINRVMPPPAFKSVLYHPVDAQVSMPGDLASMIQLTPAQRATLVPTVPLRHIYSPQGQPIPDVNRADVLILGDSYAGQYGSMQASLANQLSYELKRPVACLAVPNGGSWAARFRLRDELLEGHDLLKNKKLVVWEFAARDLSWGVWKACTLPLIKARRTAS